MGKPKEIPYKHAKECIDAPKLWVSGFGINWTPTEKPGKKIIRGFPVGMKFRAAIMYQGEGILRQGSFIECFYRQSGIPGLRDKVSMSFFAENARVLAIDENGLGTHTNTCGVGLPYYMKDVGFPHLHYPVPDSDSLYAEPVAIADANSLWNLFLQKANVNGAPDLSLPKEQRVLFQ